MNKKGVLALLFFFSMVPSILYAVPAGKVITWEGGGQGVVRFEGDEHAEKGYKCNSCHPSLFQMKKGSARITMEFLNKGQYCGFCHNGNTAFATNDPKECHECHKMKKGKHNTHENKRHE